MRGQSWKFQLIAVIEVAMERTGSQKGICSVAAAGGIGTALMLER